MSALKSMVGCACAAAAVGCALLLALGQAPAQAQSAGMLDAAPITATAGKEIYESICQGCHMPDAKGAIGAGKYPALAGDPALASRQFMALTVLLGRRNMPAFGAKHGVGFGGPAATLSYAQIAAVVNYVRSNFGNQFKDQINEGEVAALDRTAH
jgi:mono/diheme cytochrome c family protein